MNLYEYHTKPESLKWFEERDRRIPKLAYYCALEVRCGIWPDGEESIKTDPFYSYMYAINIIDGPWPDGEEAIKRDPWLAFIYARNILNKWHID